MKRKDLEKKTLILDELLRRQETDPLVQWEPHKMQTPFIESVLSTVCYENWFLAANRSGKSDTGSYCGGKLARHGTPERPFEPTTGWVVSLDYPSSRDIIQPKYFNNGVSLAESHEPFIPDREIEDWRAGDQILKLKNGSTIGFKSCDSGRLKFQGTGKDWIHFDEEPPKEIYEESVIRVAAGKRLRVFGTCTLLPPEGQAGGVNWLYQELVENPQKRARVFTASIYDNPFLDPSEIKRLEAIYPEGSVQRRIRLGGELLPGLSGSRAYVGFNRAVNSKPQGDPVFRLPLCWFWDFNVAPMVSGVGQYIDGVFKVYKEFILEEGNTYEMCEMFKSAYPRHGAEIWVYGDATGNNRKTGGESDYKIIRNCMKNYPAPIRLKVPDANPPVRDRVNAVNHACANENGLVSLAIDPTCRELIQDMNQVLSDPRGGVKKTQNRKDPYYRRTHISDGLGYWIALEAPVRIATLRSRGRVKVKGPSYAHA